MKTINKFIIENRLVQNLLLVLVSIAFAAPILYVLITVNFENPGTRVFLCFWTIISPYLVMGMAIKINKAFKALEELESKKTE